MVPDVDGVTVVTVLAMSAGTVDAADIAGCTTVVDTIGGVIILVRCCTCLPFQMLTFVLTSRYMVFSSGTRLVLTPPCLLLKPSKHKSGNVLFSYLRVCSKDLCVNSSSKFIRNLVYR